jgi:hypothetical protein
LVADNKVFASIFASGAVCAADRKTGSLLWMTKLDSYAGSAVLLDRHSLYATSCRTLYALDPDTGTIRWEFTPETKPGEWIYPLFEMDLYLFLDQMQDAAVGDAVLNELDHPCLVEVRGASPCGWGHRAQAASLPSYRLMERPSECRS